MLYLLFFPVVRILCALRLESRGKNYRHGLDAGPLEFQFLRPRGCLTNPLRTLFLCFGVIGKTPGHIFRNNFVKKIFVCVSHRDNVLARCDLIFPMLRCQGVWNKPCKQLSLSKIFFRIRRTTVLGMFKDSAIVLDAILRSFLIKPATAAMFTSVRVDFGRPLLIFYQLPSVSKSRIPHKNIWSEPRSHNPFVPLLVFLSQMGYETKLYGNSLFNSAIHDV